MATTPMSAQDALWLTMDRPNNLMVVDSAVVLAGSPSLAHVAEEFRAAVARFPVLGRKPLRRGSTWSWVDDPRFDIGFHVTQVALDEPADMAALQAFVAAQRAIALSQHRPLWRAFLVAPLTLDDGSQGSAVVTRFHHAIADGVRLTQVLLGMCRTDRATVVPEVARDGTGGGTFPTLRGAMAGAGEVARVSASTVRAAEGRVGHLAMAAGRLVMDPVQAISTAAELPRAGLHEFGRGVGMLRHPDRIVDVLESLGATSHRSMNDISSVMKLLLTGSDRAIWTGRPGTAKAVAWSPPIPMADVRRIARNRKATVNDVLVAAVAGGIQAYLARHGESVQQVVWMVPVNLKSFEADLPPDLGNHFALVMLTMPLHHESAAERLAEVHHRMQRIKNSDEAVLTFGLQRTMSLTPAVVASFLTDFFANKAVGILTNVPGPTGEMTLAGIPVRQVIGFAPCSGDQPMTATIFSYNQGVTIGFATDAGLVPDPQALVGLVVDEVAALLPHTRGKGTGAAAI